MRRGVSWAGLWLAAAVVAGSVAPPARAAGWVDKLFTEKGHDFGPVPRGAKVRHPFVVTNRLAEPVTVVDVRASCGCTTGRASASTLAPGQSAVVEAEMDTRNFVGRKETVLYVSLATAGGKQGEARLAVASTILSDIVLNPGTVDFGAVSRGQTPVQVLTIDRVGSPKWRVESMVSTCRAIDASLVETARKGSTVSYRLTVNLKPDAPVGLLRDEIRLITNDRESPVVPVQVTAAVRGDLTASPTALSLGRVESSGMVKGRVLVRSSRPFTVKGVEGAGEGFTVETDDPSPKPMHILTVAFHPEQAAARGDLRKTLRILSDLPDEGPIDVTVTLRLEP